MYWVFSELILLYRLCCGFWCRGIRKSAATSRKYRRPYPQSGGRSWSRSPSSAKGTSQHPGVWSSASEETNICFQYHLLKTSRNLTTERHRAEQSRLTPGSNKEPGGSNRKGGDKTDWNNKTGASNDTWSSYLVISVCGRRKSA